MMLTSDIPINWDNPLIVDNLQNFRSLIPIFIIDQSWATCRPDLKCCMHVYNVIWVSYGQYWLGIINLKHINSLPFQTKIVIDYIINYGPPIISVTRLWKFFDCPSLMLTSPHKCTVWSSVCFSWSRRVLSRPCTPDCLLVWLHRSGRAGRECRYNSRHCSLWHLERNGDHLPSHERLGWSQERAIVH